MTDFSLEPETFEGDESEDPIEPLAEISAEPVTKLRPHCLS